jgi:hypothetical protein
MKVAVTGRAGTRPECQCSLGNSPGRLQLYQSQCRDWEEWPSRDSRAAGAAGPARPRSDGPRSDGRRAPPGSRRSRGRHGDCDVRGPTSWPCRGPGLSSPMHHDHRDSECASEPEEVRCCAASPPARPLATPPGRRPVAARGARQGCPALSCRNIMMRPRAPSDAPPAALGSLPAPPPPHGRATGPGAPSPPQPAPPPRELRRRP